MQVTKSVCSGHAAPVDRKNLVLFFWPHWQHSVLILSKSRVWAYILLAILCGKPEVTKLLGPEVASWNLQ